MSEFKKYLPAWAKSEVKNNLVFFEVPASKIVETCDSLYNESGLELKTITATDEREKDSSFKIFYVFGVPAVSLSNPPKENIFIVPYLKLAEGEKFPSLVSKIHEASWYEREMMTFFGLTPEGHLNPQPIILHENWPQGVYPLRKDFKWNEKVGEGKSEFHFQKVKGEGIWEIPVGPVHAGIIEPGHFRFSVAGEKIVLLEPRLGYKHKGSEKLFEVLPLDQKIKLSEKISGDSSFSHSLAFCEAVEKLAGIEAPERAKYLRVVFSELERMANHLGDVGAIMKDAAYGFGDSQCSRLREMIMQWNEKLTGSRFLRGVNTIGGVNLNITSKLSDELIIDLHKIRDDFSEVIAIAEEASSLLNRLEETGKLDLQAAKDHGVLGVAARAIGLEKDARVNYPYAAYGNLEIDLATEKSGDVHARFKVRVKEIYSSISIIGQALSKIDFSDNELAVKLSKLPKNSYALGITEGWRGDIVYFVSTGEDGEIDRVAVRDPSFLNWAVMKYSVKEDMVPDFPLVNKSYNLSYSGFDK